MLKVALISPFSPGATSFFASAAVVHPHDGRTDLMCTGVSPLFSYLKTAIAFVAFSSGFRSSSVFSKTSEAWLDVATKTARALENKNRLAFMGRKQTENQESVNGGTPAVASHYSWDGDSTRPSN